MVEINNTTKAKIPRNKIKEIVKQFFKYYKVRNKDVSIAFVGEKKIREFNNSYRGKDRATDVLSFAEEGDGLGEILICPKVIKKQADQLGNSFRYELLFIIVHGLLHLIGREDDTDKKRERMIKEGEKFLSDI